MVNGIIWWEARHITKISKQISCLEELGTCQLLPPPSLMLILPKILWLFCDSCVCTCFFLSQYLTLNSFHDLVETNKALPASHLSALEDLSLSQGELFHFQSLQISLCTFTRLPTPLCLSLCCVDCDVLKDESTNHFPIGQPEVFCSCVSAQAGYKEMNWLLSLGGSMHVAVADYRTSDKSFSIKYQWLWNSTSNIQLLSFFKMM